MHAQLDLHANIATNFQLRWAIVLTCLVVQVGCQSPFRLWRGPRDEPSMEQFLSSSEPWDAEKKRTAPGRNAGPRDLARSSDSQASDNPSRPQITAQMNDKEIDDAVAEAPVHLRALFRRQLEALKGSRAPEESSVARNRSEPDDRAANQTERMTKASSPRKSPGYWDESNVAVASKSNNDRGVSMSLSDDEADESSDTTITEIEDLPAPPKSDRPKQMAQRKPLETNSPDDALVLSKRERNIDVANALANKAKQSMRQEANEMAHQNQRPYKGESDVRPAGAESEALNKSQVQLASDRSSPSPRDVSTADATSLPNSPTDTAPKLTWQDHIREAIRLSEEERAAIKSPSPAQNLAYAIHQRQMHMMIGNLDKAMEPIDGLQKREQDFFRYQFQALHDAADLNGNPVLARRWTLVLENDRKANSNLAAMSNLEVRNAAFCTEVDSYGVISKFASAHFRPNQELLLYCELDNFTSDPVKDGFETQLQGSYVIVDSTGRRVADQLLPVDSHVCRNQRRDYFIAYRIYMPQQIAPGRYQLELTIEDMKGRKFGQSSLDFQIVP